MPIACNQGIYPHSNPVLGASKLLLDAANELLIDPVSHDGKNKLLEAAKGILNGTGSVLFSFDDAEVRKIVKLCNAVQEKCQTMRNETDIKNATALVQLVMQTAQIVAHLSALSNKRVTELLFFHLQKRLKMNADILGKEATVLINSVKVMLSSKSHTTTAMIISCDLLISLCDEVKFIVQATEENDTDFMNVGKLNIPLFHFIRNVDDETIKLKSDLEAGVDAQEIKARLDAIKDTTHDIQNAFTGTRHYTN
jgi:hypothetical protein